MMGGVMVLGMSIATFTIVHVIISLVAIVSGLVVFAGLLRSSARPGSTTGST